jgi:transcriptional regulator with XRE-family HTH domain
MPPRDRAADRGSRRADAIVAELGRELRQARLAAGLSQVEIAGAVGLSSSLVSRIERGRLPFVPIRHLARLLSVVGLELSARAYPVADPLRDRAHGELLERLRARVAPGLSWRTEVPLPLPGDRRAWDATIRCRDVVVAIEAETRPNDLQALDRRLALKRRDGGVERLILLMTDSRANRQLLRDHGPALRASFPVPGKTALEALAHGRDPGGDAILML